jgi:hypothetical protein
MWPAIINKVQKAFRPWPDITLVKRANKAIERGEWHVALSDLDQALAHVDTPHARWNRAQVLLNLGDYVSAFEDWEARWTLFTHRIAGAGGLEVAAANIPPWGGEPIEGRRLLLFHELGYGDTLMLLRFVPYVRDLGAEITLLMPPALHRIAKQFDVPVVEHVPDKRFDYACPMFSLMRIFGVAFDDVPDDVPYFKVDMTLRAHWARRLGGGRKVGIAWACGPTSPPKGRTVPLKDFLRLLPVSGHLVSLQQVEPRDRKRAAAAEITAPDFTDFADVAAVASIMDEIVVVDTAAVHIAGAIGHPHISVLLPHIHDWKWQNPRWYPAIKQYRQDRQGDWASAFAHMRRERE